MSKFISSQGNKGYVNRYRKHGTSNESLKVKSDFDMIPLRSPGRIKLKPVTRKVTPSPIRVLFKPSAIIKPIQEKSVIYEKAIKAHLGISISKDSSASDVPKAKSPRKLVMNHPMNAEIENELAMIEKKEIELARSIKSLHPKKKSPKIVAKKAIASAKDTEIKLIQNSLSKINVLLNKILHKSPKTK